MQGLAEDGKILRCPSIGLRKSLATRIQIALRHPEEVE